MELPLAALAFLAGILMFIAPCTLPLVPAYLAFISGVTSKDAIKHERAHRRIIVNAIAFTLGFSIIFILFGILAGLFGSFIAAFRPVLLQIGGLFIIIFGFMMLGLLRLPGSAAGALPLPRALTPGNPLSATLIGATFALGWTPCIGPVLATVLVLAGTTTTVVQGALLLAVFSLGLAIPFILTAIGFSYVSQNLSRFLRVAQVINVVGALFLIMIGVLLLTDTFALTIEYGYILFEYLHLDGLFIYF